MRARQDLNLRPLAPEASALSTELRARVRLSVAPGMVLAVISDTHMPRGGRRLPAACVERIAAADLLLHAGDLMTLGVLRELEAIGPPVAAVHGNMDTAELRRLLPAERVVDAGGARVAVVHDAGPRTGRLERMRRRFGDRAAAVVFGHSHMPLHERGADGFQIFNPGSPTERRRAPSHTMGLARVDAERISFELVVLN
jgi:putative phosphoesterase